MPTLYDAHGNLVDFKALKRELAAPALSSVRQVLSDHPSSGLTPARLARLLKASEEGDAEAYLALAEDMEEKDLHYRAQLQTRKLAVAGLPLVVEAASDAKEDKDDADLVREALCQDGVEDNLVEMLDALGKGFSVTEILWDTSGKRWLPQELVWRDPRWFQFSLEDGRTPLLLEAGLPVPLAPYKFIVHQPRLKSGLPIRGGLARAAAWAWLFGNYALKDWVGFCELFGLPIRVGKYPGGASEPDIEILKEAVANLGTDAAAVIPDDMKVEFVEAATKAASSDLYEKLLRYLDERVTLAVLGQTLTSGQTRGGGGSLGLGKVHNQVRQDIVKADARQLAGTLNRDLVRPLVTLNRGPRERYPKVRLQVREAEDLTALAENLAKLVPLGLRVEASVVRDRFGLPDPPEGRDVELLAAPAPNQVPDVPVRTRHGHAGNCPQCAHAQGSTAGAALDSADLLTDQLEEEAKAAMERLLEPVRRLVQGAKSLEEIQHGLLALYPDMETAAFAQLFAQAMTAGAMAGRFEVGHGR